jgi:FixJ family two-component response regulator
MLSSRAAADDTWKQTGRPAPQAEQVIGIVEDDARVRESLSRLFRSVGLQVHLFQSAGEFLDSQTQAIACLVVDIHLPGMRGLALQDALADARADIPIIFLTGHGDIVMFVKALKAGAVDFLEKPVRLQHLLDTVMAALDSHRRKRQREQAVDSVGSAFSSLTNREREVMRLVTAGLMNKQVAAKLGLADITVKIYRAQLMKKMKANSLADLVRMADLLELVPHPLRLHQAPTANSGSLRSLVLHDDAEDRRPCSSGAPS